MVYLSCFYIVLVIDFMVLNCYYYIYVKGDPSLAGRFDINTQQTMDALMVPVVVTICILVVYYSQFLLAMSIGCARLRSVEMTKARKVSFFAGQVVHFFFIFCFLFGVFNRHFSNGGIQLLAYTVLNLYVYMLCILNWPVKVYKKEYDIKEEQESLRENAERNGFAD